MATQPQTQADQMKAVGRRIIDEVLNRHNVDAMNEFYAPNTVWHGPGGQELKGLTQVREMVQGYLTAFPDLHMTTVLQVAEGDKCATAWRVFGTNDGPLGDTPPTHKSMQIAGHVIARFEGGKIAEEWEVFDELAMFKQLGLIEI
jgi:steroid delta-isomerase-like uncharacterized protein